jgi:YVTN family beta-propeller protein
LAAGSTHHWAERRDRDGFVVVPDDEARQHDQRGIDPQGVTVDPTTNLIYVTNQLSNTVSVINGATNAVNPTISVGDLPIGVAVDPTTGFIYVTNSGSNTVSVINAVTNQGTATIGVGNSPFGVAVDQSTHRVYVANFTSQSVSVINGATIRSPPRSMWALSP